MLIRKNDRLIRRHMRTALTLSCTVHMALATMSALGQENSARQLRDYRDFAMVHDGNTAHGRELFNNDQRLICQNCHSIDGSSSKAGPDLFAVGDKFPRRELIDAVLEPSASIAIGYGTTIVETHSGEEFVGILKQSTADALELMGADTKPVRILIRDIKEQRGSTVS